MKRSGQVFATVTAAILLALVITVPAIASDAALTARTDYHAVSDNTCVKAGARVKIMRTKELVAPEVIAEWEGKLLANMEKDFYLSIRERAEENARTVGKLYGGSGAEVVEKGTEWTKIRSGSVEGYVKNEYCVYGLDAKEYADEHLDARVTAKEDGLKVRKQADAAADTLAVMDKGDTFMRKDEEPETDGWVCVDCGGKTGYMEAAYADIDYQIKNAVSVAEEKAAIRAEKKKQAEKEAEKIAQERAAAKETSQSIVPKADSGSESQSEEKSTPASSNDLTLLAAIIECESGIEPYAGKLAVGAVVMNRVHSSSFPNTIFGVIYQKGQFTPVRNGRLAKVLKTGNIGKDCYKAAREALAGKDNTGGAKYFHAGTTGKGLVIGTQIFY